jgi:hypothetical protein
LRLTVPSSRVAADTVEGEAVIVNLETGAYYTTEGVGSEAWDLLASGLTTGEVVEALRNRYDADDGHVEAYVQEMVATLLAEGLMNVLDADDAPPTDQPTDESLVVGPRRPFEPADLVSYHDMKGLLLLDPVHEVDVEGWPHAAAGG